jgi:hypothetical protein
MTLLSFDHYEGPTLSGDPIPPVPAKLTLEVNFGEISYHAGCPEQEYDTYDRFAWAYVLNAREQGASDAQMIEVLVQVDNGTVPPAVLDRDWQYRENPYRATLVQEDTVIYSEGPYGDTSAYIRNEIVITHEPQEPAL